MIEIFHMLEVVNSRKKMLLLILTSLLLLIATSVIYSKPNLKNKDALDFDLKKGVFLLHSYKGEISYGMNQVTNLR